MSDEPLLDWGWIFDHVDDMGTALAQHLQLTLIAVGIGFAISLPLAIYAYRHRWAYPPMTTVATVIYTIPSLALFVLLIPFTGLSVATAEIALVGYTLLILIRNIVAGFAGVSGDVREAARGTGYTPLQVLTRVEVPLALPAIVAGIRIATVTTIGLVTVTAFIGLGGLGDFILDGLAEGFPTKIVLGAALSVIVAVAADGALLLLQRALMPWSRRRAEPRAFAT